MRSACLIVPALLLCSVAHLEAFSLTGARLLNLATTTQERTFSLVGEQLWNLEPLFTPLYAVCPAPRHHTFPQPRRLHLLPPCTSDTCFIPAQCTTTYRAYLDNLSPIANLTRNLIARSPLRKQTHEVLSTAHSHSVSGGRGALAHHTPRARAAGSLRVAPATAGRSTATLRPRHRCRFCSVTPRSPCRSAVPRAAAAVGRLGGSGGGPACSGS